MESTEKAHERASKQIDAVGEMFAVLERREAISKADVQVVKEQVLEMIDAMNADYEELCELVINQQEQLDPKR